MAQQKFKVFLFLVALVFLVVTVTLVILTASLPPIIKPQEYKPMIVSEVYAEGSEKIGEYYELRRKPIALDKIPNILINAFISAEDSRFFSHKGIDISGIIRAAIKNLRAGDVVQGGSTITQQVARSLLLTREKKFSRKIKEIILSMRLEKELSKNDILYIYLNEIYLGHGAYGVEAAAQNYFGKSASELTLAEAAMLAGLPQAPSKYSPLLNPKFAKERQIYVLERMIEEGYISKKQALEARDQVLYFLKRNDFNLRYAPYFVEEIRKYLVDKYGFEKVYQDGLQIYTTLNLEAQKAANLAVEKGLREIDKRQGYRGPIRHLNQKETETFLKEQTGDLVVEEGKIYEAVVSEIDDERKKIIVRFGSYKGEIPFREMRWARHPNPDKYYLQDLIQKPSQALSVGNLIYVRVIDKKGTLFHLSLEQEPKIQGSLLSFDHKNGFIKAMVGGYDFTESEFNRAIQGRRQVGSTFKPIIYSAALERGYTPATIVVDSPIIYQEGESEVVEKWKPKNFAERFYGETTLANALAYSRNIVTIKIAQDIKIDYIADFAKRLDIKSPLVEDLSMALGSSSLTLEEMCEAFSVFARGGEPVDLVYITKIVDRDGHVLEEYQPPPKRDRVITPQLAYVMTHLLKGVIQFGTGKDLKDLSWPLAGKTGTTNDYADAWFIGYSPDLLTGVWVGFDERRKIGEYETGAKAAVPIWKEYNERVLPMFPKKEFSIPEKIVFVNIDSSTGKVSTSQTKNSISQVFIEGTEPTSDQEPENIGKPKKDEEQFYKENL